MSKSRVKSGKPGRSEFSDILENLSESTCLAWIDSIERDRIIKIESEISEEGVTRVILKWDGWIDNVFEFGLGEPVWHEIAFHLIYVIGQSESGRHFLRNSLRSFE